MKKSLKTKKSVEKNKGISLKVLEAYTRDVGRNVVRVDYKTMDELQAKTGDVIEITGKQSTVARCGALYPSDSDKSIVRIDGVTRNNAKVVVPGIVNLRKTNSTLAEAIEVSPLEPIPPIDERYLTDSLAEQVLVKNDVLMIPYFGGRLRFSVIETKPKDIPVLVSQHTKFTIGQVARTPEEKRINSLIKKIEKQITEQEKILEKLVSLPTLSEAKMSKILSKISTLQKTKLYFSKKLK